MLVKITDKCSMGCSHCMSDCTPNGFHMKGEILFDVIGFQNKYSPPVMIISGGEPTEHWDFIDDMEMILDNTLPETKITITTNGLWISKNPQYVKDLKKIYHHKNVDWQVVVDDRYYPTHVDESSDVFKLDNVFLCRVVMAIYPQGRALKNHLPFRAKSSKCFNIRATVKQKPEWRLKEILNFLAMNGKFCTPHIDINGDIKLGESALCPTCSNIYKTENQILEDIKNFHCHQCDFINDNLPHMYRQFVD